MCAIIKTNCCECGKQLKLKKNRVSKSKLYCCTRCAIPQCPSCLGVDLVYNVIIFNGKKKTVLERCLNVECLWRREQTEINQREKPIEIITID